MEIRNDKFRNTSDFEGRTGSATLNMEKLSLFMDSMISNYNYPELAVLREWVSNAHDAHVAAGIKRPVKVTLPSQLSPTLVVQDFGLGMTCEFVENFYLSFGSSSKDMSNDEIGGFGQGGKSALAIASQYTMTTVAEGLKNIYIFERSPMGGVDFKLVLENVPTDEPTGTIVQVAVDRIEQYSETNLNRVLAGWSNEDIDLNTGRKFFSIPDNGTLVDFEINLSDEGAAEKDIRAEKGYVLHGAFDSTNSSKKLSKELDLSHRDSVVLVGPVAYIFQPDIYSNRVLRDYMVASVNIGDVTFPSSREVIEPTKSNRKVVGKCFDTMVTEADKLLQARADKLTDRKSALTLHHSPLAQNRSDIKITFKNEVIPTSFTPSVGDSIFDYERTGGWRGVKDYRLAAREYSDDTKLRMTIETLVIPDEDVTVQSIRNNVRLRHSSLEHKPGDLEGYLVIAKKPSSWLKAAAKFTIKSSELAEIAKDYRKKKRDEAAAAVAAGNAPVVPVKKTRKDRIGEYAADWMVFGTNTEGEDTVAMESSDLMDFFTEYFDPKLTLVLSTNGDDYHPRSFVSHFQKFGVKPKDAQFLSVSTGSKIETLRVLLGDEVEIVGFHSWMTENFGNLASFNGRSPKEIAAEMPFAMDSSLISIMSEIKYKRLHPKFAEIRDLSKELTDAQSLVGQSYYDSASRLVRSLLTEFSTDAQIKERPEFFFLTRFSYYRNGRDMKSEQKDAIAHTMNQMMQSWLDNLALEEAEAEDAAAELSKGKAEAAAQVATLTN